MTEQNPKKSGMRRSVRFLLIGSLAFNLVIIGLVAGVAMRHGGKGHAPRFSEGPGSPIVRALAPRDRRDMGMNLRKAYRSGELGLRNERKYYDALVQALVADPYDSEALRKARENLDVRQIDRRKIAVNIWLERVDKMSPEQRQAYGERLLEVLEKPKRKSSKD